MRASNRPEFRCRQNGLAKRCIGLCAIGHRRKVAPGSHNLPACISGKQSGSSTREELHVSRGIDLPRLAKQMLRCRPDAARDVVLDRDLNEHVIGALKRLMEEGRWRASALERATG